MTRLFREWRLRLMAVLATAVLAITVIQPSTASAGQCTKTMRDTNAQSAQLGIRNATNRNFSVRFYRGAVTNNQLKKSIKVDPGKREQNNYNIGRDAANGTFIARLSLGGTDVIECSFSVNNVDGPPQQKTDEGTSTWSGGGCTRLVAANGPCPACSVSCEKSYNTSSYRWRTTFKITE